MYVCMYVERLLLLDANRSTAVQLLASRYIYSDIPVLVKYLQILLVTIPRTQVVQLHKKNVLNIFSSFSSVNFHPFVTNNVKL
jgi:hypothetical protein